MSNPSVLSPYLLENEVIVKEWASKKWDGIYATQHRVFFVNDGFLNRGITEVSYDHISSIEISRYRPLKRLVGAIICFTLSFLIFYVFGYVFYFRYFRGINQLFMGSVGLLILFGIGFLIWFIIGIQGFILHINGRKPIAISKELPEMLKYVREKMQNSIKR